MAISKPASVVLSAAAQSRWTRAPQSPEARGAHARRPADPLPGFRDGLGGRAEGDRPQVPEWNGLPGAFCIHSEGVHPIGGASTSLALCQGREAAERTLDTRLGAAMIRRRDGRPSGQALATSERGLDRSLVSPWTTPNFSMPGANVCDV